MRWVLFRCRRARATAAVGHSSGATVTLDSHLTVKPLHRQALAVNGNRIESIHIQGFRSLADVSLTDLPDTAVLIGPNGSGKSNFIRFFEMMSWMIRTRRLAEFVQRQGGADDQLFGGASRTPLMSAEIVVRTQRGRNNYSFKLTHAHPDRFLFVDERFRYSASGWGTEGDWVHLGSGHEEANIVEAGQPASRLDLNASEARTARTVRFLLGNSQVFQFHDTSDTSPMKQTGQMDDHNLLRGNGRNLASVLYRMEQEDFRRYETICQHIGRVVPGFDRFELAEAYGKTPPLQWKSKWFDKSFGSHLTSDGSLRLFALVTLLNLPADMLPDVVLLDEPELGLHPAAIGLIGDMIKSLASERQVIIATQSPLLVDEFDLQDVYVASTEHGQSHIRKLDRDQYRGWLDTEYTTGDLWQMNVLGGRP